MFLWFENEAIVLQKHQKEPFGLSWACAPLARQGHFFEAVRRGGAFALNMTR
jgi:hypothetical protein